MAIMKSRAVAALNSVIWLLAIFFGVTVLGALGYAAVEDYSWYQCLEWSMQTVTSTGYGNYPAKTMAGSLMSTGLMALGPVFLTALVIGRVTNAMRRDPNEFTDAEQRQILGDLAEIKERLNAQASLDS